MSNKPMIHCIGNAHLDPAWMWSWREGFAAFAATMRSAVERISETRDFIFTVSSAACFEYIEKTDASLFSCITELVQQGRIVLVGGWWVEPDCNLPSGESFLRQGLYGQSYFFEKFGRYAQTGYCIDSFGHAATLPMLLQACGMKQYVFMRPQEHEKVLHSPLFHWISPSGDKVVAYRIPLHYSNFAQTIEEKLSALSTTQGYSAAWPYMIFYGVGNHGGGPTKEQIDTILKIRKSGDDTVIFSSPDTYFEEIRQQQIPLPSFNDELQYHAIGAYSAHAEIKRLNRMAEAALVRSEIFAVLSEQVSERNADWEALEEAWKGVLLNQFHDTLGGVAIKEACDEAIATYQGAIAVANATEDISLARIAARIDTSDAIEHLIVFNPNSFPIQAPIEFDLWNPEASEKGLDLNAISLRHSDAIFVTQRVEASGKIGNDSVRFSAIVPVPALGWNTFSINRHDKYEESSPFIIGEDSISNGIVSFSLTDSWYMPALVCDDPSDTWGHGIEGFTANEGSFSIDEIIVVESGPIRARLRIKSSYNHSSLIEDIILYRYADQVEHRVRLDWQETRKVCKLRYRHHVIEPALRCEIPYGSIVRREQGKEVPTGRWVFAEGGNTGFGLIGPVKSSYSFDNNYLYQTIARSAIFAHHEPPHRFQPNEDKRYLDIGIQDFANYIIPGHSSYQEAGMIRRMMESCNTPQHQIESAHEGRLEKEFSLFHIDNDLVLTTLKRVRGEDGSSLIARIYNGYEEELPFSMSGYGPKVFHIPSQTVRTFFLEGTQINESDGLERKVGKTL